MGEYAEAALWAEMNGLDPADMSPEDWMDYYDESKPPEAEDIAFDVRMILHSIDQWIDEEAPVSRAEVLSGLVPEIGAQDHAALVKLLERLVAAVEGRTDG